jgi:uncharacterized damage-inducible protein DinB
LIDEFYIHIDHLSEETYPMFCHILNAHQIWNSRILNKDGFGVNQLHNLNNCKNIDAINLDDTMTILNEKDLNSDVFYQNSKGNEFSNSIKDILFHIVNHTTHHRAQIISDFRSNNIKPLVTDYIFYKR